MKVRDGLFQFSGETFSFNKAFDRLPAEGSSTPDRPIRGDYVKSRCRDDASGRHLHERKRATRFLPMIRRVTSGLQTLLMGINAGYRYGQYHP